MADEVNVQNETPEDDIELLVEEVEISEEEVTSLYKRERQDVTH